MPDRRIARDPLGELHAGSRLTPLEELLGALVGEVQARLHVDDGLADHAEAEMPRLDHPRVHRADRDLVDSLAAHLRERERPPVVHELARHRVVPEREVVGGPERMAHQGPRIGMALGHDPEEVVDLPLEARGRVVPGRQRDDRGRLRGHRGGGVDEPVLAVGGEEIVHLELPAVGPPVGGGHEHQLGPEPHAEQARQRVNRGWADRAVKLVAPHQARLAHVLGVPLGQGAHQLRQPAHCPTISTIWRSRE